MKFVVFLLGSMILLACQGNTQNKIELKSQQDSISYMLGMSIGKNFRQQSIEVNADIVAQGIRDVLSGNTTLFTDEQAQNLMMSFQVAMRAKQEAQMKEKGERNKKEGEAFLAENKKKEGVKTTTSGLQYKILKEGNGPKPTEESIVKVHYRGTFIDGTEFDSSHKRGQPTEYPVNGFVQGWKEALQMMPVGSTWQLFIPSNLAYGEQGAGGGVIGPNAVLIFELELLDIVK
jgi:FKBP-type peptidyl-prolyl cis-trans isomerase FklB